MKVGRAMQLGLKAGVNDRQIKNRLQYHPSVFEFHLTEEDVVSAGLKRLRDKIQFIRNQGVQHIILHHPMNFEGGHLELSMSEASSPARYRFLWQSTLDLLQLAQAEDVQLLVHGSYDEPVEQLTVGYRNLTEAAEVLFKRMDYLNKIGHDHLFFENSISPLFYYGNPDLDQAILAKGYRLAFDTSHCFIKYHGDNDVLVQSLQTLKPAIAHYHLVDSLGLKHDGLELGTGRIDWRRVVPVLNPAATNIYEVQLADQNDAREMVASHQYLTALAADLQH